jgi:hypothetical protein
LNAGHSPIAQLSQPTNNTVQLPEDAALRKIAEGIKSETGERFFSALVRHLASVMNCQYAFVSELSKDRLRFRTRALRAFSSCIPALCAAGSRDSASGAAPATLRKSH